MLHTPGVRFWLVSLSVFALVAAACGVASGGSGGSGSLSLQFSSPGEGTKISSPFTVTFDSNVRLDDPSTGEHHVHLGIDGADVDVQGEYSVVYGDTFEIADLAPGEHTIEASLRNADHTDAGPSDEITVIVGGGGGSSQGTGGGAAPGGDTRGGYDY